MSPVEKHPCLLLLVVALSTAAPLPAVENASFSLPDFIAELERWAQLTDPEGNPHADAARLRRELPEKWIVRHGGRAISVPATWLDEKLASLVLENDAKKRQAGLGEIHWWLNALREEAQALQNPSEETPETLDAKSHLEEILRRREFGSLQEPTWFDSLRLRVAEWIVDILGTIFGGIGRDPLAGSILVWILIALATSCLVIWLKRRLLRPFPKPGPTSRAVPAARAQSWSEWAAAATEAAKNGDFREAVHNAYWAGIFRLAETGTLKLDSARTPREYLRSVPSSYSLREPLSSLTRRFEDTWYGGQRAHREDFEKTLMQLEQLGCTFPLTPATNDS